MLRLTLKLRWILFVLLFIFIHNMAFAKMDKFRCVWRDNPATSMTIGWDQVSGENPTLYYGTLDYGTNIDKYSLSKTPSKQVKAKGMTNCFVRLINLEPNTKYFFVLKDSDGITKRYWFQTAPDNSNERLSILAGGDSRNNREGRQNANSFVAKLRPHCVVFGGDMTGLDIDVEWKQWFDDWQLTITNDGRMTPIIPARGNHEKSNESIVDLFYVPSESVYYALNIGGNLLRIYTLNTLIATGGDQRDWLEKDLKNSDDIVWKIAQYHHPMRPHTAKKPEGTNVYQSWAQLFYDYNMQLVVECDAHVCKTTYPIRPSYGKGNDEGFVRDDVRGTVYVGEGCWGAPLRPADDPKSWTRAIGSFNQIKWVWIDNEKMEIRTIKTDNAAVVGSLKDKNRFVLPSQIDIWKPATGAVITIKRSTNSPLATAATVTKPAKPEPAPSNKVISKPQPRPATKVVKLNTLVVHSIKIEKQNNNAVVTWKTEGEPDAVMCDLERSTNGFDFTTVARLALLGNTEKEQSYQLIDEHFEEQQSPYVYYRLRSYLPNGEEKYSNKEKINAKKAQDFPTLAVIDHAIIIEYTLKKEGEVTFQIIDDNGNSYLYQTYLGQEVGNHKKRIGLEDIRNGQYILSVKLTDGTMVFKQLLIN
jgi:hypothetical protein